MKSVYQLIMFLGVIVICVIAIILLINTFGLVKLY